MNVVSYGLATLAILVMGLNVVLAVRLRRSIVGGEIGQKWGLLTGLIVLFFCAYLLSPLALLLEVPVVVLNALVFGVFLFGAVFVWVVIGILRDTLAFLKLVK
jgi:hypothetical protein